MMLVACGGGDLVTRTFTSTQIVTIPATVTMLYELSGKGQDGTPAIAGAFGYTTQSVTLSYNAQGEQEGSLTTDWGTTYGSRGPDNYCTTSGPDQAGYTYETCWFYEGFDESTPATTGSKTLGFGKTFPGGVGGPAVPANYTNISVTPGMPYPLTIPTGGSITISYYE